jgi:hypothetical protein
MCIAVYISNTVQISKIAVKSQDDKRGFNG